MAQFNTFVSNLVWDKMLRRTGILLIISILTLMASCVEPGKYRTRERYVVTTKILYIRTSPSTVSEIAGTLKLGDTIIATASDKYWVMLRDGAFTGYISTDYLKKIDFPPTPTLLAFLEKLSNWRNWPFWLIAIALLTLWILIEETIIKLKTFLRKQKGLNIKEILLIHVTFFVTAILSGIVYIYWKDYFIESLFRGLNTKNAEADIITIALWIQLSLVLLGILIDFLGSIFKTGIRFGTLLTIADTLMGVFIFIVTFFLTIALNFYAIVFMVVFFTSRYIHMVNQISKRVKRV